MREGFSRIRQGSQWCATPRATLTLIPFFLLRLRTFGCVSESLSVDEFFGGLATKFDVSMAMWDCCLRPRHWLAGWLGQELGGCGLHDRARRLFVAFDHNGDGRIQVRTRALAVCTAHGVATAAQRARECR